MTTNKTNKKTSVSPFGTKKITKKEVKEFYRILNASPLSRSKYKMQAPDYVSSEPVFKQTTNAGV